MAIISEAGSAYLSELYIGTKFSDVTAVTATTLETATTGFLAVAEKLTGAQSITAFGPAPNNIQSNVLGEVIGRNYKGQPNAPTISFTMDVNPDDAGQKLVLANATTIRGVVLKIIGADSGIRYKVCNAQFDCVENIDAAGAYTADVTMVVQNHIEDIDQT